MEVLSILATIIIPICVTIVFLKIKNSNNMMSKNMTDDNFTILVPSMVKTIGVSLIIVSFVIISLFSFTSDELPNIIFYIVFSLFIVQGTYMILKTDNFRIDVNDNIITVCTILKKQYTFTFNDICSAKRQTKQNKTNSERIVIKTTSNKKLIVESTETSYDRFLKKIKQNVDYKHLQGFDN